MLAIPLIWELLVGKHCLSLKNYVHTDATQTCMVMLWFVNNGPLVSDLGSKANASVQLVLLSHATLALASPMNSQHILTTKTSHCTPPRPTFLNILIH